MKRPKGRDPWLIFYRRFNEYALVLRVQRLEPRKQAHQPIPAIQAMPRFSTVLNWLVIYFLFISWLLAPLSLIRVLTLDLSMNSTWSKIYPRISDKFLRMDALLVEGGNATSSLGDFVILISLKSSAFNRFVIIFCLSHAC
jgi:hypothetical protein